MHASKKQADTFSLKRSDYNSDLKNTLKEKEIY